MENYLGYHQVKSIRKPSQVDSFRAKAILGMTPPRCRQVRLSQPRYNCTGKGGFESNHPGESGALLNVSEGQAAGRSLRQKLS
jgi:hypothetical protein